MNLTQDSTLKEQSCPLCITLLLKSAASFTISSKYVLQVPILLSLPRPNDFQL